MNKHIKAYEQFVNETSNEGTLNESVYGEYVKKVGPALTKFLKEKGLNWPTPFKATEQKGYIQIDSAPVSGKDLGIMQYGFKSVVLSTRFGTEESTTSGEPDLIVFGLSYQYEHPNGGTNGTDLVLPGTRYSNIFYSKTHDKFYTWETQPNPEMKMNESELNEAAEPKLEKHNHFIILKGDDVMDNAQTFEKAVEIYNTLKPKERIDGREIYQLVWREK